VAAESDSTGVAIAIVKRLWLCALSVVGMVLCVANYDIWLLGFVAWVPLYAACEGTRPRGALFYGWFTGTFTVFWGFFWLTELLTKFAGFGYLVSLPITLLFASYHGLLWGFAMMLTTWLTRRSTVPLWIVAPLCWVAIEATLPNIFPIYMAQGWASQNVLIQMADLGGVTTVSAVMVALNAGIYRLLLGYRRYRKLDQQAAAFTGGLLVLVLGYGLIRIAQVEAEIEAAPKFTVGVVQGNMSIREMSVPKHRLRVLADQQRVSAELEREGAQLVVWGETAYPNSRVFHRRSQHEPPPDHPWHVRRGFSIPVIVGAVTRENLRAMGCGFAGEKCWNTAYLIGADGTILDTYDKVYRLVFGEYAPIVDPDWYLRQVPSASHLEKGSGPKAMALGDVRLGPFICYEDILPRYVRETANQGVHMFVNLTNDAWFGKTHEPWQHLGLAVFRSVEHRKGMVRAVNTGVSAYIDPTGKVDPTIDVTDPDVDGPQPADGFAVDVPLMDPEARTLYGVTGELFNVLCILGVVFVYWRSRGKLPADAPHADPRRGDRPEL
jgi:apolipoprotein N-acyltransferase